MSDIKSDPNLEYIRKALIVNGVADHVYSWIENEIQRLQAELAERDNMNSALADMLVNNTLESLTPWRKDEIIELARNKSAKASAVSVDAKTWLEHNVWDGEDRLGTQDSAIFSPDELLGLFEDFLSAGYPINKPESSV